MGQMPKIGVFFLSVHGHGIFSGIGTPTGGSEYRKSDGKNRVRRQPAVLRTKQHRATAHLFRAWRCFLWPT